MAESFVRLVGADEQVTLNAQPEALAWVAETDILSRLLARSGLPILPQCCPTLIEWNQNAQLDYSLCCLGCLFLRTAGWPMMQWLSRSAGSAQWCCQQGH